MHRMVKGEVQHSLHKIDDFLIRRFLANRHMKINSVTNPGDAEGECARLECTCKFLVILTNTKTVSTHVIY